MDTKLRTCLKEQIEKMEEIRTHGGLALEQNQKNFKELICNLKEVVSTLSVNDKNAFTAMITVERMKRMLRKAEVKEEE